MKTVLMSLFIFFLFTGCNENIPEVHASGKKVHIGLIFADNDNLMHKRLKVFKVFQKQWGLLDNGDELVLHAVSIKKDALSCFNNLLKEEKMSAVISFLDSTLMLDLKQSIEKNKVPVISIIATHSKVNEIKYVSRICLNNPWQASVAAAYIRDELFISNINIIRDESNDFSLELSHLFQERYKKMGGKVFSVFNIKELENSPKDFIKKMNENKVEALFLTINAQKTEKVMKLLQKLNHKVTVLAHDGLLSAFNTKFPKEIYLLDNIFVIDNYADDVKLSKKGRLLQKYKLDKRGFFDSYNGLSYDSWSLLRAALNRCKDYSGECVNDYMRNASRVEGVVEAFSMKDGNALRAVYVNKIKDAKMKIRVKVY